MTDSVYSEWKSTLRGQRLPAALVDLDAFDRNTEKVAEIARSNGKRVRIATKSIRVPELIKRVLDRGAPFHGLMCYSAEEAAFLATQGFDDLMVAYPTVQASDLGALRKLHEEGKRVSLVFDSVHSLEAISAAMVGVSRPFPVLIDVDMSLRLFGGWLHLGVRRSPVRTDTDIFHLIKESEQHRSRVKVIGAMAYEAQIAGLGDRNPFKPFLNPIAQLVRSLSLKYVRGRREGIARVFREQGLELEVFNGGGTGSLNWAAEESSLTEITAGSALFSSHLFDNFSNICFEPALYFALQAVRRSDPGYITCQGGGYIASGEPGWDRVPVPVAPGALKLVGSEGCGEVQTPVQILSQTQTALGDPVLFRHAKAGELAERFNEYLLISRSRAPRRTPTYRGLGLCFF